MDLLLALTLSPWAMVVVFLFGVIVGIAAVMLCDRLIGEPDQPHAEVEGLTFHSFGGLQWPVIDGGSAPDPKGLGTETVATNLR